LALATRVDAVLALPLARLGAAELAERAQAIALTSPAASPLPDIS
jgi:hypothetical protein